MHVSQFSVDRGTGEILISPPTINPGREHAPRSRRVPSHRPQRVQNMRDRSRRAKNAVIIGAPKKARRGSDIRRVGQTGTGGNAVRAIPTGPVGNRIVTDNPVRVYQHADWQRLSAQMRLARIAPSAIRMVERAMEAALSRAGYSGSQEHRRIPAHTAQVVISGLTAAQWQAIDAAQVSRRAMRRWARGRV